MPSIAAPDVKPHVLLRGYREALDRFQAALESTDPEDTFLPLFEVLNWAAAIDDRFAADFAPDGLANMPRRGWEKRVTGEEVVRGVRFARNRVHHQWALAVDLRAAASSDRTTRFMVWVWRPVDELPEPDPRHPDKRGQPLYETHLADKPVEPSLIALEETFKLVGHLLEPRQAAPSGALVVPVDPFWPPASPAGRS
jgi:hypothetical protein